MPALGVRARGVRLSDQSAVVIKRFSFAGGDATWGGYQAHERELRMLQSLTHPRIPAYLADFQTPDGFCMVQEFCDAPSIAARRSWSLEQVTQLARSALAVLSYLQERVPPVVHRDLKPDNILVDDAGNAYLVDFGLARADRARATTLAVGTPGFMAPEQMWGQGLTLATDLYGLGAALMTALTGTASTNIASLVDSNSFRFDLSRLPENLSSEFKQWLAKLVAPGTRERFGSARKALTEFEAVAKRGLRQAQAAPTPTPAAAPRNLVRSQL